MVGKFFRPRAVLNFFFVLRDIILKNQELKITFLHELQVDYVEISSPRAKQNTLVGRIWPAGRTLPTPAPKLWIFPYGTQMLITFHFGWRRVLDMLKVSEKEL